MERGEFIAMINGGAFAYGRRIATQAFATALAHHVQMGNLTQAHAEHIAIAAIEGINTAIEVYVAQVERATEKLH
jgi:hypothetical protein